MIDILPSVTSGRIGKHEKNWLSSASRISDENLPGSKEGAGQLASLGRLLRK